MRTHSEDVPVEPTVTLADNALANKVANEMVEKLSEHLVTSVPEKFNKANEPNKNKD